MSVSHGVAGDRGTSCGSASVPVVCGLRTAHGDEVRGYDAAVKTLRELGGVILLAVAFWLLVESLRLGDGAGVAWSVSVAALGFWLLAPVRSAAAVRWLDRDES